MADNISNPTPITPPRVPFIDSRTGLIDRAWYMFLLSMFRVAETSDDVKKAPDASALMASYDAAIRALQQQVDLLPRDELGTMAALQQDNVPWLRFNTQPQGVPTGAAAHGTLYWDNADAIKTLNIVMEDSGAVVQQIGEETYYRIKASSAITDGQVVMFTGTVGASGALTGAPATGLTAFQNDHILGIATQNIAHNQWGYVTWFGVVRGVNTTGGAEAWADGELLYYNPAVAGGLTKIVPTAPNPKVIVANVIHAATNGSLFVRPSFGSVLGQTDSNVQITGLASGDLLIYDAVQARWENAQLTAGSNVTITPGAGSITIAATTSTSGASGTVTLAAVTGGGTTGSLSFSNGLVTGFTAPT